MTVTISENAADPELGTIATSDANIWWNPETKRFAVVAFRPDQDVAMEADGFSFDDGASWCGWRVAIESELVQDLLELAIRFMVAGFDPPHVLRELAKIKGIAALGAERGNICRALTKALDGREVADCAAFRERL
jgi:hypothetical protein